MNGAGVCRSDSHRSGTKIRLIPGPNGVDSWAKRHSRRMVWLVAVLVALLILAIILGAVLGSTINSGHSSTAPQVTEIPAGTVPTPTTTQPTKPPTGTKMPRPEGHLASVAVTGWRVPGPQSYNSIWLFWQNKEGYLSRAAYNSSTGNWTRVTNFAQAKDGSPLAAAAVNLDYYDAQEAYSFPAGQYQASVVYLDENNYLNEWTFSDTGPDIGQAGSLNKQQEIAHEETQLGFYWPQLVYQGMSGEIRAVSFECHRKDQCWHESVLDTGTPRNGTPLITSPSGNNLSSTALFYQEEDGRSVYFTRNSRQENLVWSNAAFSYRIPSNASIASFSTTRSKDPTDESLNEYLLWQDTNGTIQMSWTDSDDGWQGPATFPAFAGADNNTALTCLTGLTFPDFPLQTGTELSRCYFQTGLALREVSFDGKMWNVVGVVPIDL
ncbi:hypothetical protein BKA66DRAFT_253061 [Pyrenochaeta sp. MPI-SDFR-AT-0127]|nr:hypothetical protein BKA66DRAFT_253061 [Pyrenochaeta sp. MPI-SDFR-AT-0127]